MTQVVVKQEGKGRRGYVFVELPPWQQLWKSYRGEGVEGEGARLTMTRGVAAYIVDMTISMKAARIATPEGKWGEERMEGERMANSKSTKMEDIWCQ
ncbi:hypothetical protein E2562_010570 [Oryza meyeriana var. granulata]|uniref:Uncharacterized protein n=1 Tax=Oryza meyeriana var. granulata TaxID=110450 RepID=A0A6G1BTZ1_9ORYZ|nr:hypothetical protein E2562_010570 [Oryza meyeriana var. granulata]